jgi:hypothetical protein
MPDEKDRFGDKMRDAEKAHEDQYFAKRDRALLQKLKADVKGQQRPTLGEAGSMLCPKCGERLVTKEHLQVTIDECPACQGIWLDKGELEQLAHRENAGWLARYLGRSR